MKKLFVVTRKGSSSNINKETWYLQYQVNLEPHLKISVKYVGPVVVYRIIDPKSFQLCTSDGKLLLGLFEHERLKPAVI